MSDKKKMSPPCFNKLHIIGLNIPHVGIYGCDKHVNMIICIRVNIECFILKSWVNHDSWEISISLFWPTPFTCT